MKILKRAEQKNVILNKYYYTEDEIKNMLNSGEIFFLNSSNSKKSGYEKYERLTKEGIDIELRIFTSDLKELKVVLDEYGMYTTVGETENGRRYYITL